MKGLEPGSTVTPAVDVEADRTATRMAGRRHAILKAATHEAHAGLDSFTMRAGFFDNPARFIAYLQQMAHFHHAYAQATHGSDPLGWRAMWHVDRHGHWIAAELDMLGGSAPLAGSTGADPGTDPAARALAPLSHNSASRLLGSLYVLAGSALGARMLHRLTVARAFPVPSGSSYLSRLGGSLSWQQFLAFLESATIGSEDRMIEGALATFAGVQRSLELGA